MNYPAGESYASNVKAIGYCDLDGRPGFKLALHKSGDRWYLYTAKFWHPGFSIVEVTDPANPPRFDSPASTSVNGYATPA